MTVILLLTLFTFYVASTTAQPTNIRCVNSMLLDPLVGGTISGYTTKTNIDAYYKIVTSSDNDLSINATFCKENDNIAATILVRKGENCQALEFVKRRSKIYGTCASVSFVASKSSTYVFRFRYSDGSNAKLFNFTLNGAIAMRPPNDECSTAIPLNPFAGSVKLSGTTKDSFTDSVYYKFKVGMENEYEISLHLCKEKGVYAAIIEILRGDDCEMLEDERYFSFGKRCEVFTFRVSKSSTYILRINFRTLPFVYYVSSTFNMTATSRIVIPPPNDECVEAILVDPLAGKTITGTTVDSYGGRAYYKFNVGTKNDLVINITVCVYNSEEWTPVFVYKGDDCDMLENVRDRSNEFGGSCRTASIIASKSSTYFFSILSRISDPNEIPKGNNFNISFSSRIANAPPNDECKDAIVVDPFEETTIVVDTTESSTDAVFYQVNVGSVSDIAISIIECGDVLVYVRNSDCIGFHVSFSVGDGDDSCGTVSFLASENLMYFIELRGIANVTLKSKIYSTPLNFQCTEAKSVDPLAGERFVANLGDSLSGRLFYTMNVGIEHEIEITIACCSSESSEGIVQIEISDNCESVITGNATKSCTTVSFIAPPNSNYIAELTARDEQYRVLKENLTVEVVGRIVNRPPNDECDESISVDPFAGKVIEGDVKDSVTGSVYYTVKIGSENDFAITTTLCIKEAREYDLNIFAYKDPFGGENCVIIDPFNSFGCFTDSDGPLCCTFAFIPSKSSTYIFEVSFAYDSDRTVGGSFDMTTSTKKSDFFVLIDAKADSTINVLESYLSYLGIPTSSLNIEPKFDSRVKSVRMTFDNPKLTFCDNLAPYSVFGDIRGNYSEVTIPLGSHVVTATSYTKPSCSGPAGKRLNQTFYVEGCDVDYFITDSSNIEERFLFDGENVVSCQFNIRARIYCGFEPKVVKLDLYNKKSGEIVRSRTDANYPYTLYRDGSYGKLRIDNYTISSTIDGIYHPSEVTLVCQ